jgi:hypothetical protein
VRGGSRRTQHKYNFRLETITRTLALAGKLEGEGQINNAKLLRAAVDSFLTRSAYRLDLPHDRETLVAETGRAIAALSGLDFSPELLRALESSKAALAGGRLPHYEEAPDPFVCRTCGHLALGESGNCPVCSAHPDTLERFRAVFWLEAFDPYSALEHLRSTPEIVAGLIAGASDEQTGFHPREGGWSLGEAVTHLRDAQGVLDYRVDLILDQENPLLESKAIFEWATAAAGQPATAAEIFETYRASREKTLARLETIPLQEWWRPGRHEEFGGLRLFHQASYFACHELTHLPQITSLARSAG